MEESVLLQWTFKFSFKMIGKQTCVLAKLKCSMHHLTMLILQLYMRKAKNAVMTNFTFICLTATLFKK